MRLVHHEPAGTRTSARTADIRQPRPAADNLPFVACVAGLLLCGCTSPKMPDLPESTAAAPAPAALPVTPTEPPQASALSYGMVTSQVRKGETTQLELVQLFGSPNISSYDSAGIETWVYERTVTQTDIQTNSKAVQGAANLGVFFNFGQAGAGVSGERASVSSTAATSVRSITVIVKFAANRTVSDYSVRASYF